MNTKANNLQKALEIAPRRRTVPLNRSERSEYIRSRILDDAAELFFKKGYGATSLADIAKSTRLNKATISYYFKAKSNLLDEVVTMGMTRFIDLARPIRDCNLSPDKKLEQLLNNHLQFQLNYKGYSGLGIAVESKSLPKRLITKYVKLRDEYESIVRGVLKEGMDKGWKLSNIKISSLFILGFINSVVRWYQPNRELDSDQMASEIWRFVCSGLGIKH